MRYQNIKVVQTSKDVGMYKGETLFQKVTDK